MAVIKTENITRAFWTGTAEIEVLKGVSLEINQGEFVSIVGKSGSGKTTLMNILGCLDQPTSGTYFLDGEDVAQLSPSKLARIRNQKIGFVFQTFNLIDDLTALDNVALPQLYAGVHEAAARAKAAVMLEAVDLIHRALYYPHQLSGGERQRIAIARAMVNEPAIILADEPTGNLDSKTGDQIFESFVRLNQNRQITVIIVTHDPDLARATKRTITIADGRIVSQ